MARKQTVLVAGILTFLLLVFCSEIYCLKLTHVLALGRHNLRTPLTVTLAKMTPKIWPKWDAEAGQLTQKGAVLEGYMGEYFAAWLHEENLLPHRCPEKDAVHIYANTKQRTKDTAKAFAEAAFKNCNVKVHVKNIKEMDPIFNPVVHNMTDESKYYSIQEMQKKLNNSDLNDVYLELNRITDIEHSEICRDESYCDLSKDTSDIVFEIGEEPNVTGPFFIGSSMVDSFLMSLYEGMPYEDIAWGEIKTKSQWKFLTKIVKENQNVRFNLTTAARDIAKPLLKYMRQKWLDDTKFTMLVGHDSNLSPVLSSLGFKPFVLPGQFELTPIGGKLVFQKWSDGIKNFLKVEYVYQSWKQIRNAEKLTICNPPRIVTMHLQKCVTDNNGLCPWGDFEQILNDLVEYFCLFLE